MKFFRFLLSSKLSLVVVLIYCMLSTVLYVSSYFKPVLPPPLFFIILYIILPASLAFPVIYYSFNCFRCVKYSKYLLLSGVFSLLWIVILFINIYIPVIVNEVIDLEIEQLRSINDKWEFLQPIYAYSLVASVFVGLLIITIKGYNKIKLGRFYLSIVLIIPYLFFNFSDPKPESVPPIVGNLSKESPEYELGIRAGDIITKIDDVLITSWGEVSRLTFLSLTNRFAVTFLRDRDEFTHVLTSTPVSDYTPIKKLNLPAIFPPIVRRVLEGQAAAEAGLQKDDKIVSIGGVPIDYQGQVMDELQKNGGKPTEIIVERWAEKVALTIAPRLINKKVIIGVQFGAKKGLSTYVMRAIESKGFFNPAIFNLWLTMANIIALIQIYIINRFLCSEIEAKLSKS